MNCGTRVCEWDEGSKGGETVSKLSKENKNICHSVTVPRLCTIVPQDATQTHGNAMEPFKLQEKTLQYLCQTIQITTINLS